jgi:hypothetical protein
MLLRNRRFLGGGVAPSPPAPGAREMSKNWLKLDWSISPQATDFNPVLARYRRYLKDNGFRESSIESYVNHLSKFLEFAKIDREGSEGILRAITHKESCSKHYK